jgi:hypothetical protein
MLNCLLPVRKYPVLMSQCPLTVGQRESSFPVGEYATGRGDAFSGIGRGASLNGKQFDVVAVLTDQSTISLPAIGNLMDCLKLQIQRNIFG